MTTKPKGAFGISWGDDTAGAAKKLGLVCAEWRPWRNGSEFVTCGGNAEVLAKRAHVDLVAAGGRVEGLIASFPDSEYDALVADVAKAFGVEPDSPPLYVAWRSGEAIRFEASPAGGCFLTVAGPPFGRAVQSDLLRGGLAQFAAGVKP